MKEWEKTEIEEGRPDGKISRRQFVKGMAWGAAAISLSSILRSMVFSNRIAARM